MYLKFHILSDKYTLHKILKYGGLWLPRSSINKVRKGVMLRFEVLISFVSLKQSFWLFVCLLIYYSPCHKSLVGPSQYLIYELMIIIKILHCKVSVLCITVYCTFYAIWLRRYKTRLQIKSSLKKNAQELGTVTNY